MGGGTSDTVNLVPVPEAGSISTEAVILGHRIDNPSDRRWRWQRVQIPTINQNLSAELDQSLGNLANTSTFQAGRGSVAAEERINDVSKMCGNTNGYMEDNVSEDDDVWKSSGNDGSVFGCNVPLILARDPVLTCCGHLFCWSCLYRWLDVHSDTNECPVCKREVTCETVIPIYGHGNITGEVEDDSGLKIPPRRRARLFEHAFRRIEALRKRKMQIQADHQTRLDQQDRLEKQQEQLKAALEARENIGAAHARSGSSSSFGQH